MGDLIEIGFVMWIIGVAAFAPLAYFLYLFTVGNGESFGKSDPSDHHVEETGYYKFIDMVMRTLLGGTNNIPVAESKPSVSATVSNSARKPRTISATAAARSTTATKSPTKKPKKVSDKNNKSASKKEAKNKKNKSAKKSASKTK